MVPQPCPGTAHHSGGLTKFLGALALAGQLAHLHEGIEVAFGSIGHTWGRRGTVSSLGDGVDLGP